MKRRIWFLILSVAFCALAMSYVDAILQPGYLVKSVIKLVLFLLVPMLYFLCNREELSFFKMLFRPTKVSVAVALGMGAVVYGAIVGAYFLLRGVFDFSGIVEKLGTGAGVNADNFLYVSIYISLVNSFLEEFFFRGFGFLVMKQNAKSGFACLFSALMFAIYHGGMTAGYYHIGIFLLTLVALFFAGVFFNVLVAKSKNIYTSWLVHICANWGINTVGMILFGIL